MLLAKGGTHMDKAAFSRLNKMMGEDDEVSDEEWESMCSEFGATEISEEMLSVMFEEAQSGDLQDLLAKAREAQ